MKNYIMAVIVLTCAAVIMGCGSSSDEGAPPPTDKVSKQFETGPTSGADAPGGGTKTTTDQAVSDK